MLRKLHVASASMLAQPPRRNANALPLRAYLQTELRRRRDLVETMYHSRGPLQTGFAV